MWKRWTGLGGNFAPESLETFNGINSSSSIDEKYAQISKSMTRDQVIEIMDQPTSTETRKRIECLTWDINTPNRMAYYGIFIDLDKDQVLDVFSTKESVENSKSDRWKRYLSVKIDKIIHSRK